MAPASERNLRFWRIFFDCRGRCPEALAPVRTPRHLRLDLGEARPPVPLRNDTVSTADYVAFIRAVHMRERHRILEDPHAAQLCGPACSAVLRLRALEWVVRRFLLDPILPLNDCLLLRARYTEEALLDAIRAGMGQYVIVGAGMDSWGFRNPGLLSRCQLFEIDHPATQADKLARASMAGLAVRPGHHFVPADLSVVSAVDALVGSGFDPSRPAFASMLGVTYYLPPADLLSTLESLGSGLEPGTQLAFDYLLDESSVPALHRGLRGRTLSIVRALGEPMRGAYSAPEVDRLMDRAGFEPLEHVPLTDLAVRFARETGAKHRQPAPLFGYCRYRVRQPSAPRLASR